MPDHTIRLTDAQHAALERHLPNARNLLLAAVGEWGLVPEGNRAQLANQLEAALSDPSVADRPEYLSEAGTILVTGAAAIQAAREWGLELEAARRRLTECLTRATLRREEPGQLEEWRVRSPWDVTVRVSIEPPLAVVVSVGEVRSGQRRRR